MRATPVAQSDPFVRMRSLEDAMDRMFGNVFFPPAFRFETPSQELVGFVPAIDLSDTDRQVLLRVNLPGVDPKEVHIEVTEDTISISGKIDKTLEEQQENFYRIERSMGTFSREFALPSKVNADTVRAEAANGVIKIVLDKLPSEQKRPVEVKVVS